MIPIIFFHASHFPLWESKNNWILLISRETSIETIEKDNFLVLKNKEESEQKGNDEVK